MSLIRLIQRFTVDVNGLVTDFELIAGYSDDPLDQKYVRLKGRLADDDVLSRDDLDGDQGQTGFKSVSNRELVDQNSITGQNSGFHGRGRDTHRVNDVGGQEQGEDAADDDGNEVLAEQVVRLSWKKLSVCVLAYPCFLSAWDTSKGRTGGECGAFE